MEKEDEDKKQGRERGLREGGRRWKKKKMIKEKEDKPFFYGRGRK